MNDFSDDLQLIISKLNNAEYVQQSWYRRNHILYPMVSYVNNLLGLYLSGNNTGFVVFIERIYQFIEDQPYSDDLKVKYYYQLVLQFISMIGN